MPWNDIFDKFTEINFQRNIVHNGIRDFSHAFSYLTVTRRRPAVYVQSVHKRNNRLAIEILKYE